MRPNAKTTECKTGFHKKILIIDNIEYLCNSMVAKLKFDITQRLRRNGGVVGISGGIDSSVTLALAVRALGPDKVLGLIMPDQDSSHDSAHLAEKLASRFKVKTKTEDITNALKGFGCYERRDEAVKNVFPEYNPANHKMKIGIKSLAGSKLPPLFSVFIIDKDGNQQDKKLTANDFMQIVSASNLKQRTRMAMLYYHAERLYYAVIGTPNKHEVDQGFFVKYGDGGADVMPIANLYKTQVYQLAEFLNIPTEIIERTPTTDTYSAEQSQEEFFYQLPFDQMDLLWFAYENKYDPSEVASVMSKSIDEVINIYENFNRKSRTTEYLRMSPIRDY